MNCQTMSSTRAIVAAAPGTVMLSGIASLGVKANRLIDDQHRRGRRKFDGGTDLDEVRRHGVGVAPKA